MFRYVIGATALGSLGYLGYTYARHYHSSTRDETSSHTNEDTKIKKVPSQTLGSYMILTDLEPDDMVAMGVLASRLDPPSYIVVGEGSADLKFSRAMTYVKHLGWEKTVVVKGLPSSKHFEGEEGLVERHTSLPDAFCSLLPDYFTKVDSFICLKPPRELCARYKVAAKDFKNKRLILYGSFNLRTIVEEEGWDAVAWMFDASSPFKEVVLYESYKAIPDAPSTSANEENCPAFWSSFDSSTGNDAFKKDLSACLAAWDKAILFDCEETMKGCQNGDYGDPESEDVKARYSRNKTCRDQDAPHQGRQFVMADCVLATVLDNPIFEAHKTPIKVGYDAPYLVKTLAGDEPTNVYTYEGMSWEDVTRNMTTYFRGA